MSGIILDFIIIAVIVFAAVIGRYKGFIMTLFSLGSIIIAIILSSILQPVVTDCLNSMGVQEKIGDKLYQPVSKCCSDVLAEKAAVSYESLADEMNLPEFLSEKLPDKEMTADIIENNDAFEKNVKELSTSIAGLIVSIFSFIAISVVITIILFCLSFGLKLFSKLPVINRFDKSGGLILGILIGFLICFALLAVVQVVGAFTDISKITTVINDSFIGEIFYKNNLLLMLAIIL